MNLLSYPELFYLISTNLNDKEKILLTTSSKKTYGFQSLIILDLEYNLEEISNKLFNVKNIIIKDFLLETKIKELLKNLIPESITMHLGYVRFVSNNTNIKLLYGKGIIRKIVSYECSYLAMKIMLNNDDLQKLKTTFSPLRETIENINKQFIKSSRKGYLDVVKLLIKNGANVRAQNDEPIIRASECGHLEVVKLLIENEANVRAQNDESIIRASERGHLKVVKLLIENGPPKVVPTFSSPSSPPAPFGSKCSSSI